MPINIYTGDDEITTPVIPDPIYKCGAIAPQELRFGSVRAWDEANPVLSEQECYDTARMMPFVPPIMQQQNNNCTDAALSKAAAAAFRYAGVKDVPTFSPSYIYAQNNGGRDQGAMCRDCMATLRDTGTVPESMHPANDIFGRPTAADREEALKWRVDEVYQCLNWAHVRSALARDFIVYHGFVLGNAFFRVSVDGRVPEFDGAFANGHAMYSVGLTRQFGDLRAITVNSWGPSFGRGGYCYTPASYFWDQRVVRGQTYVNLDAFAIRSVRRVDSDLPSAA